MTDIRAGMVEAMAYAADPTAFPPNDTYTCQNIIEERRFLSREKRRKTARRLAGRQIAALYTFAAKSGMSGWLARNQLRFPFAVYFVEKESDAWIRLAHRWNLAAEHTAELRAAGWTIEPVGLVPGMGP